MGVDYAVAHIGLLYSQMPTAGGSNYKGTIFSGLAALAVREAFRAFRFLAPCSKPTVHKAPIFKSDLGCGAANIATRARGLDLKAVKRGVSPLLRPSSTS